MVFFHVDRASYEREEEIQILGICIVEGIVIGSSRVAESCPVVSSPEKLIV